MIPARHGRGHPKIKRERPGKREPGKKQVTQGKFLAFGSLFHAAGANSFTPRHRAQLRQGEEESGTQAYL